MTRHFWPPAPQATAVPAILIDAARCWRDARDSGQSVQPSLSRMLAKHDCGMLAPVFDSLMTLCEAALGRSITVGAAMLSDDEHMLLGLLDGSRPRRACIDCAQGPGSALDCAICSTRIMMALAFAETSQRGPFQ